MYKNWWKLIINLFWVYLADLVMALAEPEPAESIGIPIYCFKENATMFEILLFNNKY